MPQGPQGLKTFRVKAGTGLSTFRQTKGPDQPGPQVQKTTIPAEAPSTMGFLANIPKSGSELVGSILSMLASPVESAKAIGQTALHPKRLLDFAKERYGGIDQFLGTAYRDPVGVAADIAALTGGGGIVARGAGLAKTGRALSAVSEITDPLRVTGRLLEPVAKTGGQVAATLLGTTTGMGGEIIKTAAKSPTVDLLRAMRGKIDDLTIIRNTRAALDNLRAQRGLAYRQKLAVLKQSQQVLDLGPVQQKIIDLLDDYNIQRTKKGTLDFSRSTIHDAEAQAKVSQIVEDVESWGTKPGDLTVISVDTLKRRLSDFYAPSSQARQFVQVIKNETRNVLDAVPGYKEMTSGYNKASELIDSIDNELSLGGQSGTIMRKLANSLNQNNEYRKMMIEALDQHARTSLKEQIAGSSLSKLQPSGIMRPLTGGAVAFRALTSDPTLFLSLFAISPRLVGEIVTGLSRTAKVAKPAAKALQAPIYRPLSVAAGQESP